ncbi:MAG: hypothetical protein HW416_1082 [Chloroflexi bacterium]|nr:hypothetical protein [Chloroflexota bacterium]
MRTLSRRGLPLVLLLLIGCAQPSPGARPERSAADLRTGAVTARGPMKTLTIGQINPTKTYGPWDFSNTQGGGSALIELHTVALKTSATAARGDDTRLASKMPSFDDGSMVVLPDGRLQVTWSLRKDAKWHDGQPVTADDLVFSWRVISRPDLLSSRGDYWMQANSVEAVDPYSLRMTWPTTFFKALDMGADKLWPFPKHILGEPLETITDRDQFLAQPFFTTQYLGAGPFRVTDWGFGENQVLEAFDQYFMGRPKVDRVTLRTVNDVNTMLVNMRARTLDMLSEKTLPLNMFLDLRDDPERSGEIKVVSRQENWRYIRFQFHPEYARPIELAQDPRLRRGMLYGLDREGLRELVLPGVPYTNADTFMPEPDPRMPIVGQPFARYPFDQRRAIQEFDAGGWRRAADGRLMNAAGQQVQLELRGNQPDMTEIAFEAAGFRQLGIDVTEYIPSEAVSRSSEFKAKFPALETTARSTGDEIFIVFDSRLWATPENRWEGSNRLHYANPALDRLIDGLASTIGSRHAHVLPIDFCSRRQGRARTRRLRDRCDRHAGPQRSSLGSRLVWIHIP